MDKAGAYRFNAEANAIKPSAIFWVCIWVCMKTKLPEEIMLIVYLAEAVSFVPLAFMRVTAAFSHNPHKRPHVTESV